MCKNKYLNRHNLGKGGGEGGGGGSCGPAAKMILTCNKNRS